jgi:hypothetical protein
VPHTRHGWQSAGDRAGVSFQASATAASTARPAPASLLRDHPGDVDATAPIYLHHYDLDTLQELGQRLPGLRPSRNCGHDPGTADRGDT